MVKIKFGGIDLEKEIYLWHNGCMTNGDLNKKDFKIALKIK